MSTLTFKTNFHSEEMRSFDLPLEIRRPDLKLVTRTRTSQQVEIPPGTYHITARLPAGQELQETIVVSQSEHPQVVILSPESGDESPSETFEMSHFLLSPLNASQEGSGLEKIWEGDEDEEIERYTREAKLQLYVGNHFYSTTPLLRLPNIKTASNSLSVGGMVNVAVRAQTLNQIMTAQLLQPGVAPINVVLPNGDLDGALLVLQRKPNGTLTLDAHIPSEDLLEAAFRQSNLPPNPINSSANALLRYMQRGDYHQAAELLTSNSLTAQTLLRDKKRSPISACVGAYALLRFNQLEKLHDWTRNLYQMFPWLSDGAAIYGEHLAREGQHKEALLIFLRIQERGLPIFSDGVMYALNRLRTYSSLLRSGQLRVSVDFEGMQYLLNRLDTFAAYMDFSRPFTTYTSAAEPTQLTDETLRDKEFQAAEGENLDRFLPD